MKENVCLVCLKTFQSFPNDGPSSSPPPPQDEKCGVPLLTKFLKFAKNYLKVSSPVPIQKLLNMIRSSGETFPDAFCERCEPAVVAPICKVYLEYLSAQLRLSWELKQLGNLLVNSQLDMSNQSRVMNVNTLTEQLGVEGPSNLEEFRSLLFQKCQLKRKETLPDVLVQSRCRNDESIRLQIDSLSEKNDDDDDECVDLGAVDPFEERSDEDETEETFEVTENGRFELKNMVTKIEVGPVQLPQDDHLMVVPDEGQYSNSAPDNWHKCSKCERFFDSLKGLHQHMGKCSGIKQQTTKKGKVATAAFPCGLCHRLFPTRKRLNDHKYHAHTTKWFKCSKCDYIAKARSALREHFMAVHNPQTHVCGHCPRTFATKRYLQLHIRKNHPFPGQTQLTDGLEGRLLSTNDDKYEDVNLLESRDVDALHLKLPSNQPAETNGFCENIKVQVDPTKFLQEFQHDDHHLIIPENEHVEEVDVDDHSLSNSGALDSWHKCEKCGRFFESSQGVNRHVNICSGTKPTKVLEVAGATVAFPCGVCDKLFPTQKSRDNHKYRAHATKRYKCPKCHVTFKSKGCIKQHLISIHNPQTLACGQCDKTFTSSKTLKYHFRRAHPLPGQG